MGTADIQGLISGAEKAHALPCRHPHISNAVSALAGIDDNLAAPEDLKSLLSEIGRIATGMNDGELIGLAAVVGLIDQAHDCCDHIRESTAICGACNGSGEGRYFDVCHVCCGKGEVQQ